jgi:DnaK suppressor protein
MAKLVPSHPSGLLPEELARCRELLETEQEQVRGRLKRHEEPARAQSEEFSDEIDQANRDAAQAVLLGILTKEQKLLREIEQALARLDDGTYGVCEGTGEPIGARRLFARPWARYSAVFKEQLERSERSHST